MGFRGLHPTSDFFFLFCCLKIRKDLPFLGTSKDSWIRPCNVSANEMLHYFGLRQFTTSSSTLSSESVDNGKWLPSHFYPIY